jgi:hypothetical protein
VALRGSDVHAYVHTPSGGTRISLLDRRGRVTEDDAIHNSNSLRFHPGKNMGIDPQGNTNVRVAEHPAHHMDGDLSLQGQRRERVPCAMHRQQRDTRRGDAPAVVPTQVVGPNGPTGRGREDQAVLCPLLAGA